MTRCTLLFRPVLIPNKVFVLEPVQLLLWINNKGSFSILQAFNVSSGPIYKGKPCDPCCE